MQDARPDHVRPHALFVAWEFAPLAGGGVPRSIATVDALLAAGYDVTVVTSTADSYHWFRGLDESLAALVDPAVAVVRVPFAFTRQDRDIGHWSRERAADPRGWLADFTERSLAEFPEPGFGPWLAPLGEAIESVHRGRPVDLAIAAGPHAAAEAVHRLHAAHGVPYAVDHRQPWRLDPHDGSEAGAHDPRIAAFESAWMASASRVWFLHERARDWQAALYPEAVGRMRVVPDGVDPGFARRNGTLPAADRSLTFGFVGTLHQRDPLAPALLGWMAARESSAEVAAGEFSFWCLFEGSDVDQGRLLGAAEAEGVRYRGPVAYTDVAATQAACDALVLIQSRGAYVPSAKVYPYMASARPIVSVHDADGAIGDVLRGYPLWFPAADLTPGSISDAIVAAASAARSATAADREACEAHAARFGRSAALGPAVAELTTRGVRR